MSTVEVTKFDLSSFDLDAGNIDDFADLRVLSLADAMAMPETGASSGVSSCGACSCCGSTSCCAIPQTNATS